MREEISQAEYLQLLGLLTLAVQANRKVKEYAEAFSQITDTGKEVVGKQGEDYFYDLAFEDQVGDLKNSLKEWGVKITEASV